MMINYCSCQFNRGTRSITKKGCCAYCGLEVDER